MLITETWQEVLQKIALELRHAHSPLKIKTLTEHLEQIVNIKHLYEEAEDKLAEMLQEYEALLTFAMWSVRENDRGTALTAVKFLHDSWLPKFEAAFDA